MTPKSATGDIIAKLEQASGPDRKLDAMIQVALDIRPDWCRPGTLWIDKKSDYGEGPAIRLNALGGRNSSGNPPIGDYPRYTASLDASLALVEDKLPGWWHTSGKCGLTCHASIGPDRAFIAEPLLSRFDGGFDADLPNPTTQAIAVLVALFKALEAQ